MFKKSFQNYFYFNYRIGRDSNQKLKLFCFGSHEARRLVSRSQRTSNIKHGKAVIILQSCRFAREYLCVVNHSPYKQRCLECHRQAYGQDTTALWNTILGKINAGFKGNLARETERMIQQKTQMHTFLFSKVFKINKHIHI